MSIQELCVGTSPPTHSGRWRLRWTPVFFLIFHLPVMDCFECHTLEFQYMLHYNHNNELQFHQTTIFDKQIIFTCDGSTLRDQPRQDWITKTFTTEELNDRHENCKRQYHEHLQWFQEIKETTNDSTEILQRRQGCILNGSGVLPFDQWSVNGEDFLTFEFQSQTWTPATHLAAAVAVEWNKQNERNLVRNNVYRNFGKRVCEKHNRVLETLGNQAGKTTLEVHLFAKPNPGAFTLLSCHVTDSNLSGVKIQLTENGRLLNSVQLTGPLPNGDGTFQMRLQAELRLKNTEGYSCNVQSTKTQKSVLWDGLTLDKMSPPLLHDPWINWNSVVFGFFICVLAFVAYSIFLKRKMTRQKARGIQRISTVNKDVQRLLLACEKTQKFEEWVKVDDQFYIKKSTHFQIFKTESDTPEVITE